MLAQWRACCASALAVCALLNISPAHAQTSAWPNKPVHFIVPFPAGGSTDIVARLVAQLLSNRLGQQFVVENRVGASGNLGSEAVARAAPDGYTIGLATTTTHALAPSFSRNLPFDPVKDFAPVSMLGSAPFVLVVPPSLPAKDLRAFIALAKSKPKALSYGSAGAGSLAHLAAALFANMAGIEMVHVPELPTIGEAGLPGYEASLWMAVMAPSGTPASIIEKLSGAIAAELSTAQGRDAMLQQGMDTDTGSPEALAARIREEIGKWREVISRTGITAEP